MDFKEINRLLDVIESNGNLAEIIEEVNDRGRILTYLYENGYITEPTLESGGIGSGFKIASARNSIVLRRP